MLSNGVTAKRDSVKPAPNPARTVRGPDILPSSFSSKDLNVSNATKPGFVNHGRYRETSASHSRIPAFREFPIINVVQPANHCLPNGGQDNFCESGNFRLSWLRVFATVVTVSDVNE